MTKFTRCIRCFWEGVSKSRIDENGDQINFCSKCGYIYSTIPKVFLEEMEDRKENERQKNNRTT